MLASIAICSPSCSPATCCCRTRDGRSCSGSSSGSGRAGAELEGEFYDRYKDVRERLYNVLRLSNPRLSRQAGELLRLTQKLLDRFIFAFFCEDMGERMLFPPQMHPGFLRSRSDEPFYDENGSELWDFFKRLFGLMNSGGTLNRLTLPEINGGLFAAGPAHRRLEYPQPRLRQGWAGRERGVP